MESRRGRTPGSLRVSRSVPRRCTIRRTIRRWCSRLRRLRAPSDIIAPRLFSTGTILYGAEGNFKAITTSFDDALAHLRRMKAVGAFSVKSYNQPRRDARQQIIEAARQLRWKFVPEGGSTFSVNTTMFLDGHTTLEHNLPVAPLYEDMLKLISTVEDGVHADLRRALRRNERRELLVSEHQRLGEREASILQFARIARLALAPPHDGVGRRLLLRRLCHSRRRRSRDRGALVNTGAHGQQRRDGRALGDLDDADGRDDESRSSSRGDYRTGRSRSGSTRMSARSRTGKLADLIVLDANPLSNISNTETIRYVMVNGRIYDTSNMAELGNHPAPAPKRTWRE